MLRAVICSILAFHCAVFAQQQPAPRSLNPRINKALKQGKTELGKGHVADAQVQFELALSIATEQNLEYEQAEIYNWLGNAHQEGEEPAKARSAYEKALSIASRFENEALKYRLHINLGLMEADFGKHKEAIRLLQSASTYFIEQQDSTYSLIALNGLGYAFLHSFKMDSAKLALETSLDLATRLLDTFQIARAHTHLGSLYYTMLREEVAASHYEKALNLFHALEAEVYAQSIYFDLLKLYISRSEIGKTHDVMDKYFQHFESVPEEYLTQYGVYEKIAAGEKAGLYKWLFLGSLLLCSGLLLRSFWSKMRGHSKGNEAQQIDGPDRASATVRPSDLREALAPIIGLRKGNVLRTYIRVVHDQSQQQIALELGVSEPSVSSYVKLICEKLNTNDVRVHALKTGAHGLSMDEFNRLFDLN